MKFGQQYHKMSYSQCGEDLIIDFLFKNLLKLENPSYLDIGAHHPIYLSNTYLFYTNGAKGVCIEPDPILHRQLAKKRKRDICLNVGIGVGDEHLADFYLMTTKTLNTFSKSEAERYQGYGSNKIEEVVKIKLLPVNQVIKNYFPAGPNFISLDVEGLDLAILKSIDFSVRRPEVFCVETLTYTENNTEQKIDEIINYMTGHDYFVYADTFVNTIFVSCTAWKNRR